MDPRRTQASDDAGKGEPAGAPEPRAVPKTDRARTEQVIDTTLPPGQRSEPAGKG